MRVISKARPARSWRWALALIGACGVSTIGTTVPPAGAAASVADSHAVVNGRTPADSHAVAAASTVVDGATVDSTSLGRAAEALSAKAESTPAETLDTAPAISVPVFVGGKEVFRVRSGRDGLSPTERAAAIRSRITTAVKDAAVPSDSVRMLSTPQGVEVRLGRYFLWVITPDDAEGVSASDLAARIAELPARLREGVEKERAGRRPLGILISVLIALGITLAAWLLVRLLMAASRRWHAWLTQHLPRHVGGIRVRNFEVLSQAQATGMVRAVLSRIDLVIGLVLLYVYLTSVFSLFPWTQGWSWQLLHFATTQAMEVLRSIGGAIPGLLVIAVIVVLFRWLTQLSDRFFDAIRAETLQVGGLHPELARPSKRLIKIVLWIAAVIVAFPYIPGAQSKAFQGVSLFIGVLFSLGSTGFVGNVISGIVLTFSRSFRTGDRVKIGEVVGDVTSQGFFATKLRTIRNEEITMPNGQVAASAIVNYTRLAEDPGLILHTEVTIGYDVDWRTVHGLLTEAADRVEGIEKDPAPWVYQRSLNDYHISYELNCVTHLSHPQLKLYSGLHQEIQDAFARAGVEILSPGFHAIRDANTAILPQKPEGPRPPDWGFRLNKP